MRNYFSEVLNLGSQRQSENAASFDLQTGPDQREREGGDQELVRHGHQEKERDSPHSQIMNGLASIFSHRIISNSILYL